MKTQTEYTSTINQWFTNKAAYLAWREAWRKHYALLSEKIREEKRERKNPDPALRGCAQYHCWALRQEATELLALRKKSKEEAQRQYLASKAAVTEASAA